MKYFLILFSLVLNINVHGQNVYEIRLFDKSTGQSLPLENLTITSTQLTVLYGQKEIIFPILEKDRPEKYLDIFIDTTFNSADCFIYFHENTSGGYGHNGGKCSDDPTNTNFHVIRNLPKFDKTPKADFSLGKFIDFSPYEIYLNTTLGSAYQGFQVGASLKYAFVALIVYVPWNVNVQCSKVISGPLDGGIEFAAGLRCGFLGTQFRTFLFEGQLTNNIAPEIAIDLWLFHLSYSYNFSLSGPENITNPYRHRFELGLGINLSTPVKSMFNKFPCCTPVHL